jgi:hypothetical protein
MTHDEAKRFASDWVEACNRHDIDAVLAHCEQSQAIL